MPVIESTPRRMVLASGKTSLTLDKDADTATLQRKLLFWKLKPLETPLSGINAITTEKLVDRASGIEMFNIMLVTAGGTGWAMPAENAAHADSDASSIRTFLGLSAA